MHMPYAAASNATELSDSRAAAACAAPVPGARGAAARPRASLMDQRAPAPRASGGSRSIPRRWKKAPNEPASTATTEIA